CKTACMKHGNLSTQLAPLVPPACGACSEPTRLVGLEPAVDGDGFADLCTYECNSCGEVQTRVFLRSPGVQLMEALDQAGTNGHSHANGLASSAPEPGRPDTND